MPIRNAIHIDRRVRSVNAPPEAVFRVICRMGGKYGWFSPRWMWWVRGWMDRMIGGPGLAMGRRHPETLRVGDILDCWHVAGMEPDRRLELHALMKLPGQGMLVFTIDAEQGPSRTTLLTQSAEFAPSGFLGTLYWMSLLPAHDYVFGSMIRGIARAAEREAGAAPVRATRAVTGSTLPARAAECESIDQT